MNTQTKEEKTIDTTDEVEKELVTGKRNPHGGQGIWMFLDKPTRERAIKVKGELGFRTWQEFMQYVLKELGS